MSQISKPVKLSIIISQELYNDLHTLAQAQNASFSNNISRLLREGMNKTYSDYPLLRDKAMGYGPSIILPRE